MKRKVFKNIMVIALAVATITTGMSVSMPVHAEENVTVNETVNGIVTPDGEAQLGRGTASITILPNSAGQSLLGKKFEVYKLFDAENAQGLESINYTFNPAYKQALQNVVGEKLNKASTDVTEYEVIDYIQLLNINKVEGAQADQEEEGRYSDFRYFIEALRDEMTALGNSGDFIHVSAVKADGTVALTGLDYGYYVIDEVSDNAGNYSASSLCIVSTANPAATVQVKSDYPGVMEQIQEDDYEGVLDDNGWNDIADYEIGQTVPYRVISNVPDMNGYANYYYAWHDVMNRALTFHADSVKIVIQDENTSYELVEGEYTLQENVDGETFVIAIADLKAIVDREFNHKDSLGHNTYEQEVVLTYNATLNDTAAEDAGIPGFENDVRLEFSNDPDATGAGKTGFTPWDTSVCFTYKLNILKTNNHDLALKDAKFRLYSDKDCAKEVYVKKTDLGYIVINQDTDAGNDAVEMVSDDNGEIVVIGLDAGTYYLKETDAPDGYRAITDPIEIKVIPTYKAERNEYAKGDGALGKALTDLQFTANIKQFLDGILGSDDLTLESNMDNGEGFLTVVNHVGAKLPITGSSATIILIGLGSAIMVTSRVLGKKKGR